MVETDHLHLFSSRHVAHKASTLSHQPAHCLILPHDVADEFPSSPSHIPAEVFYLSHLQDFFVCNSFLPAYHKYPSKTYALEDVKFFLSILFIFHVSQPYIKTGFTSVLYSLTLIRRLMLLLL